MVGFGQDAAGSAEEAADGEAAGSTRPSVYSTREVMPPMGTAAAPTARMVVLMPTARRLMGGRPGCGTGEVGPMAGTGVGSRYEMGVGVQASRMRRATSAWSSLRSRVGSVMAVSLLRWGGVRAGDGALEQPCDWLPLCDVLPTCCQGGVGNGCQEALTPVP